MPGHEILCLSYERSLVKSYEAKTFHFIEPVDFEVYVIDRHKKKALNFPDFIYTELFRSSVKNSHGDTFTCFLLIDLYFQYR